MTYVKSAIEDYTLLLELKESPTTDKPAQELEEDLNLFSLLQSLSIAHFNEGVEWEHLRSYEQALTSYEASRSFALRVAESGPDGAIGKAVESAMYQNASKSIMDL